MRHTIAELIGNTEKSYYRWKAEGRLIITLLEKYFTKNDLEEFIKTKKISRLDLVNNLTHDVASKLYKTYFIHLLAKKDNYNSDIARKYFINYLYYVKYHITSQDRISISIDILFDYLRQFDNAYTEDLEENRYMNSFAQVIKIINQFSITDINYILSNIDNDFKYFIDDLTNIVNKDILEKQKDLKKNKKPEDFNYNEKWKESLVNTFNATYNDYPNISIYDILIFKLELICIQKNLSIQKFRAEVKLLSENFEKQRYSNKLEDEYINNIKKIIKKVEKMETAKLFWDEYYDNEYDKVFDNMETIED